MCGTCGSTDDSRRTRVAGMSAAMAHRGPDDVRSFTDYRLPDAGLVKADRANTRVSLEVRTPYLSRELAEFAATVPDHIHLRDGDRALLRGLLARVAPRAAERCSRTRFEVPAADWLRGPLAPLVDRQLAHGSAFTEGWFDRREAPALVAEHRSGIRDASGVLWPLLAFGLWLDRTRGVNPN